MSLSNDLPQVFRHSVSGKGLPVFVQDDVPSGLLQPIRALLQNHGAICIDEPQNAAVIIISHKSYPLANSLVEQYSVAHPESEVCSRAVVNKLWIMDCIESATFLGPPLWGGHYVRKRSNDVSNAVVTSIWSWFAAGVDNKEVSTRPTPSILFGIDIASGSPSTIQTATMGEPNVTSDRVQAGPSDASNEGLVHVEGHGGAGNVFTDADEAAMVDYILSHEEEHQSMANRPFWKLFCERTVIGKTRTINAWARRFSSYPDRYKKLIAKARSQRSTGSGPALNEAV